jgi:hypothetical protein
VAAVRRPAGATLDLRGRLELLGWEDSDVLDVIRHFAAPLTGKIAVREYL